MALGGNKNLQEFFQKYDLNDEEVPVKYNSTAAEYYRVKLRSMSEGIPFDEEPPSYNDGRAVMTITDEEFEEQPQVVPNSEPANSGSGVNDYLNSASEYLTYAATTVTQKATEAGAIARSKADESGMTQVVSENASYMGKSLADLGESTKNTFSDLQR